jgi:hypothetical protein
MAVLLDIPLRPGDNAPEGALVLMRCDAILTLQLAVAFASEPQSQVTPRGALNEETCRNLRFGGFIKMVALTERFSNWPGALTDDEVSQPALVQPSLRPNSAPKSATTAASD